MFHASNGMHKSSLIWWNPYWAHCPVAKKKWSFLFNRYSIISTLAVAFGLGAFLVLGVKQLVPQLDLRMLWKLGLEIPALFALLYLYAALDRLIPARIVMKSDRIVIQRGETVGVIYFRDLSWVRLTVFSEKNIRVSLRYRTKKGEKTLRLGLPAGIKLQEFVANFRCQQQIYDARDLYAKIGGR
jgi:hypothetical protein